MSQTLELLRSMRDKIATGWTTGCCARNRQGNPVVASSPEASQWCMVGSVTARVNEGIGNSLKVRQNVYRIMELVLADRNEPPFMDAYNDSDGRTREEVLEVLDEAISVAKVGGYE